MALPEPQRTLAQNTLNNYLSVVQNDASRLMELRHEIAALTSMLQESDTTIQNPEDGSIYCVFNPPNQTKGAPEGLIATGPGVITPGYQKISFAVNSGSLTFLGITFPIGYAEQLDAGCGMVYPQLNYDATGGQTIFILERP